MTHHIHEIGFLRWHDDVELEKRTLFHMPSDKKMWTVGDSLRLRALNLSRCKIGVLTSARQVRLLEELDADLAKLHVTDRAEYLARWDALHPGHPSVDDPLVWRIEFRYGVSNDPDDPPEWSLAS